MASLIKNQILKHLSKFTKNLSPDKINLSTLKGEGELSNLELDESVLTELLELPTWLKLTKAVCNRVSIKIQWTKLKSQPIWLLLDEVLLEVETCDTPRPYNVPSEQASYRSGGKYGFSDKVIDGMSVAINSVNVNFRSRTFEASLQLSRVQVYSVTPTWQKVTDLRTTRIKDMEKGEILVFKEVDWQTTRIEANGINISDPAISTTPLRLIANQSKIRITLKKKLSDCSVVSSRVTFLLDDLLWVLTDTQLKAAIVYSRSLEEAIEKSAEQSKKLAAEKLKKQGHIGPTADQLRHQLRQQQSTPATPSARFFAKYDVISTSYHLISSRIDLHLCDDAPPSTGDNYKRSVEGGAMQITLQKLSVDYYPYHPAGGERKSWYRYADNLGSRNHWVQQLFSTFKEDVRLTKETCSFIAQQSVYTEALQHPSSASSTHCEAQKLSDRTLPNADGQSLLAPPSGHGHRSRAESGAHRSHDTGHRTEQGGQKGHQGHRLEDRDRHSPENRGHRSESGGHTSQTGYGVDDPRGPTGRRQTKLLESCFVLKVEEFTIFQVSTPSNRRGSVKKFLCSDKKQLHLPPEMSVLQLEFTEYFFTEGIDYPVPHPNLYILINPVRLTAHYNTVLWTNYFLLNLAKGIKLEEQESGAPQPHVDIKLEAVMPRLVIPSENRVAGQMDRPDALQVQISRLTATNCRVENKSLRTDLQKLLKTFNTASLFSQTDFPNDQNNYVTLPQQFCDHATNQDNPFIDRSTKTLLQGESLDSNPRLHVGTLIQDEAFDIWSVAMDQIWVEFTGVPSSPERPVPCVESIPLTLWFCNPLAMRQAGEGQSEPRTQTALGSERRSDDLHARRSTHHRKDHNNDMDRTRASKKLLRQHYTVTEDVEYVIDPMYHSPNSLLDFDDDDPDISNHINGVNVGDSTKDSSGKSTQLADFYVLMNLGGKLRAQVNHYQYLFMMRLLDSYTDFQKRLNSDMEHLTPGSSASTEKLCASMVLQEIEFAMVCPAVPQPSVTPSSLTYSSPLTMVAGLARLGESMDSRGHVELQVPSREFTDDSGSAASHASGGAGHQLGTSPSRLTSTSSVGQGTGRLGMTSDGSARSSDLGSESGGIICPTPLSGESNTRGQRPPFKRTTSAAEVKKSLTSAWTAFSDKLKSRSDLSDDSSSVYSEDYDSMSINTEMSSDDDFEFMGLEDGAEAPAFEHHGTIGLPPEAPSTVETASVTPDDMAMTGVSRDLILAEKAKEHVSVIVFKLTCSELLVQSLGSDVTVRGQVQHIGVHESGNIIYEDFYNRFSTSAGYVPVSEEYTPHPPIRLKYVMGPSVGEAGFLDLRCQGLELHFLMSSIGHLTDLIEDEILPKPLPMSVLVSDIGIHLKEDRPPNNFTNPGTVPLIAQVAQLTITRGDNGVFHIRGEPLPWISSSSHSLAVAGDKLTAALNQIPDVCLNERLSGRPLSPMDFPLPDNNFKLEVQRLTQQNAQLQEQLNSAKCQLAELEELRTENQTLRAQMKKIANLNQNNGWFDPEQGGNSVSQTQIGDLQEENNNLIERISYLEDELKGSHKEKDSLVATLRLLQEELLRSESKRNTGNATSTRQRSPRR